VGVEAPLITNDAVVLGLLCALLGLVFYTQSLPFCRRFYSVVPGLLLCYFLPSLLSTFGVVSPDHSQLYKMASRYLLPACLVLLTVSVDMKAVWRLGPKALVMFLVGSLGIVLGGPLAFWLVGLLQPEAVGGEGTEAVWRGLTTIAGSWIGGSANQTAMKEVFQVGDQVFSSLLAVDILMGNLWMAVLLFLAGRTKALDSFTKADTSAIDELQVKMENYQAQVARIPSLTDLILVGSLAFGATGLAHFMADWMAPAFARNFPQLDRFSFSSTFFWIVVLATTFGLLLSTTPARKLEGAGASKLGSVFLYLLVATIGMNMDISATIKNPWLFVLGGIWIAFHALLMLTVGYLIKAPFFFVAVGSQANVGGAASAPVVAGAFHPALAPVGALLAVLGYALGTYGAWFCGQILRTMAGA